MQSRWERITTTFIILLYLRDKQLIIFTVFKTLSLISSHKVFKIVNWHMLRRH